MRVCSEVVELLESSSADVVSAVDLPKMVTLSGAGVIRAVCWEAG